VWPDKAAHTEDRSQAPPANSLITPAEELTDYADYDDYILVGWVLVAEVLSRALGTHRSGQSARITVLDALMERLGHGAGRLKNAAYDVLRSFEDNVGTEGKGGAYSVVETFRVRRVAEAAVRELSSGLIVAAMPWMGWGNIRPDAAKRVTDISAAVRSILVSRLAPLLTSYSSAGDGSERA
jgi:hypothetical protein